MRELQAPLYRYLDFPDHHQGVESVAKSVATFGSSSMVHSVNE